MFNKNFKLRTTQGTPVLYQSGIQVIFEGKVYNCLNSTSKTPFQEPASWSFNGLTEAYYSDSPPLKPVANQVWINSTGVMYTYIDDGNSNQWVQL
jgi:hypothetical protein